jgi:DNA-binding transcriptional ArsR family regulator
MMHSPTDDLRDLRAVFSAGTNLSAVERAVLACLLLHRNGQSGRCDPSLTTIGREAGIDRRTVMRAMRVLEESGYVTREQQPFPIRTQYTVTACPSTPDTESPVTESHQPDRGTVPLGAESPQGQRVTGLGAERPQTRGTVPPKRTKNERKNERREIVGRLWDAFVETMDGSSLKLTDTRQQKLAELFDEHLNAEPDPLALFRAILAAVKADDFRMKTRAYHMPESLFKNAERREARAVDGRARLSGRHPNGRARNPLVMSTEELREWEASR